MAQFRLQIAVQRLLSGLLLGLELEGGDALAKGGWCNDGHRHLYSFILHWLCIRLQHTLRVCAESRWFGTRIGFVFQRGWDRNVCPKYNLLYHFKYLLLDHLVVDVGCLSSLWFEIVCFINGFWLWWTVDRHNVGDKGGHMEQMAKNLEPFSHNPSKLPGMAVDLDLGNCKSGFRTWAVSGKMLLCWKRGLWVLKVELQNTLMDSCWQIRSLDRISELDAPCQWVTRAITFTKRFVCHMGFSCYSTLTVKIGTVDTAVGGWVDHHKFLVLIQNVG